MRGQCHLFTLSKTHESYCCILHPIASSPGANETEYLSHGPEQGDLHSSCRNVSFQRPCKPMHKQTHGREDWKERFTFSHAGASQSPLCWTSFPPRSDWLCPRLSRSAGAASYPSQLLPYSGWWPVSFPGHIDWELDLYHVSYLLSQFLLCKSTVPLLTHMCTQGHAHFGQKAILWRGCEILSTMHADTPISKMKNC